MRHDASDLVRHYAELSDEQLFAIDSKDLRDDALVFFESEVRTRRKNKPIAPMVTHSEPKVERDWTEDAAAVCSYVIYPGQYEAQKIDQAREVLEAAGILCRAATREEDGQKIMELLVPSAMLLHANSVMDLEIFNPETEEELKTHFAALSDGDLAALNPKDLTAGLRDRAERLERVYAEERGRQRI